MTVAELMEILKDLPPNMPVYSPFGEFWDNDEIKSAKVQEVSEWVRGKGSVFFPAVVLVDADRE